MTDSKNKTIFRLKLELLLLTEAEDVLNRAKDVISKHYLTFRHLPYAQVPDQLPPDLMKAQLILISQNADEELVPFTDRGDRVLRLFPRGRVVTLMSSSFSRDNLEGSQNPRVTPLSQTEFFSTLKFEYLCMYRCRAQYVEVPPNDLFSMTKMLFPAFVRLSLNQRYLAVVHSNTILSDERFARLTKTEGLYVQLKDAEKYLDYIRTYFDTSGVGLKKRARALFLAIYYYSLCLNESLLFDFKSTSAFQANQFYSNLQKVGTELVEILKTDNNLWDVFREAHAGDFELFWRAPWIAVYGTLISVKSAQGNPLTVLMAGLLADTGIYDLEEATTARFLFADDKAETEKIPDFQKHPLLSLNRCLLKNLPLSEEVKEVLICTHERADQKGFPNQVPSEKLPVEAQIIRFAEKIDQGVNTTMKNTGVGFRFMKEKVWEAENAQPKEFSATFLANIADALI
ncbi:MAG: hypothetical protein HUU57_08290 [Bdellovibrio sp.]|nr:hypothetical protein [Bdellovibrio sp.]